MAAGKGAGVDHTSDPEKDLLVSCYQVTDISLLRSSGSTHGEGWKAKRKAGWENSIYEGSPE